MPAQDSPFDTRIIANPSTRDACTGLAWAMLMASVLAVIGVAWAAEPDPAHVAQPMIFDIPAQPLVGALHAYGRMVGVQVLYESRSAAGRQSVAVRGRFTPEEALKRLLGNTDLEVRRARADAITLVAPAPLEPVPLEQDLPPINPLTDADIVLGELRVRANVRSNDLDRFADYSETVRSEIQRALLKNPHSATGNYRAVLDLWIDSARTIRKAVLLQPTGNAVRDAAITSTLQGLMISRATPPDAPQPIRAVVAVSTSK